MKFCYLLAVTGLICSAVATQHLQAAPTQLQQAEVHDKVITKIHQDENELINVNVDINGDRQQYTFTPDEVKDTQGLKEKLAHLDEKQQKALIKTLQKIPSLGQYKHLISKSELSPEMQQKLADLKQQMASKEEQIAVIVKQFETDAKALEGHTAAMEQKAREIEIYFDQHGDEMHQQIDVIADEITTLAEQIVEIEIGDLDIDLDNLQGEQVFVFRSHDEKLDEQQLSNIIEHADISEQKKQQILQLLQNH
ncbi:hypothetical protein [Shewanella waksmanii]|uniref:hypothetical protein n=1 Tax=Shewanella waksmanii TaxID=213783 RepID=UPI003735819E